ncbi:hypothetical protein [Nguyenibacter sp. L1]|uniref:hypothetical protein n=1 Tax=Nguyenibacter sp. L1 TaxID=3049350 RepID=UPI002B4A3DA1|nr:hypothetical protein [Nguyenibacter sp. L1]WRH88250.1 hypothetical protein QN315_00970 [Nguyenibacter sp. L1]
MRLPLFASLAVALALQAVLSAAPAAALPLPANCAVARAAPAPVPGGAAARDYKLRLAGGADAPSLRAGLVTIRGGDGAAPETLPEILNAASVGLLGALSGRHAPGCSTEYFATALQPVLRGLAAGRAYDVAWRGVEAVSGRSRLSMGMLRLHLDGAPPGMQPGVSMTMSLEMHGLRDDGAAVPAALLPEDARSVVSLPVSALAPLLAATAGGPVRPVAVPVTIRTLTAAHGDMRLDGSFMAVVTGVPDGASASGHMRMRNLPELIAALRDAGQTRASAALVLANLVGHHADDATSWDVDWQGGILTVNRIPLPLR